MSNPKVIELRHQLHQHPELSNQEFKTSERISQFMQTLQADAEINVGATGKLFVFEGKHPGATLMFRAELDALPIAEESKVAYTSLNKNTSHACGHDGHMAIIAGLAQKVASCRPEKGKVVFLFQPAEEVEQGARDVVNHPEFKALAPDYIFALHNIPGQPLHKVILKTGAFAAASKGLTLKLYGKTSHAAEPEKGISPDNALSLIIKELRELVAHKSMFSDVTILTIIHMLLGEISFGTSPGYAELRATLRAFENVDMELLTNKTEAIIKAIAKAENLRYEISYGEVFPATINDAECVALLETAAEESALDIMYKEKPFTWSEDFAYYTQQYKGGFFGLGAGETQPELHHPDYDFPDEIIQTGIEIFYNVYKKIAF